MNVAVLPARRATLRMMYLASITWSALSTSECGHQVDLALAAGGDLVEVGRRGDPALRHALSHLGAEVHQAVGRRAGEITEPGAGLVAEVGRFRPAPVPCAFDRIDVIKRLVPPLFELNVVEDEELQLGCQQALIGQSGVPHVAGGLAGDVARVAGIVLVSDRVVDVADHRQRRLRRERVDQRRLGLGDDQQVGLVDRPPAHDTRAVKPDAFLERLLGQSVGRNRKVLPDAGESP